MKERGLNEFNYNKRGYPVRGIRLDEYRQHASSIVRP